MISNTNKVYFGNQEISQVYVGDNLVFGGATPTYDADAQAYFERVEAEDGQTLEPAVKTGINDFVVGCKADGIWDAIKASCILAGARTLSGALQPLVGTAPTSFNFVNDDYNRKTGIKGDGSTKYLDSGRNNNADPQNSQHLSIYTHSISTGSPIGNNNAIASGSSTLGRTNTRSRNSVGQNWPLTTMFAGISRGSSSSYVQRTGGSNTTRSQSSEAPSDSPLTILRQGAVFCDARLSFYSIGEALDLTQLDTRVSNLITAIGAAIP